MVIQYFEYHTEQWYESMWQKLFDLTSFYFVKPTFLYNVLFYHTMTRLGLIFPYWHIYNSLEHFLSKFGMTQNTHTPPPDLPTTPPLQRLT